MKRSELEAQIRAKKSVLCVGLDTDPQQLPPHLHSDPEAIFNFNRAIIEATAPFAVAYKPNTAFYEAEGLAGWEALAKTAAFLKSEYPEHLLIADAKRGDIGNTARRYAQAFLEKMPCDAITVAPYMGEDSVSPFLEWEGKWAIVLALTSNAGAEDFQLQALEAGAEGHSEALFERVLRRAQSWSGAERLMFVVGATRPQFLQRVRAIAPEHFLLIPGVGAQGGSVAEVMQYACAKSGPALLINSSRGIIYRSSGRDFAQAAAAEAEALQKQMAPFIA